MEKISAKVVTDNLRNRWVNYLKETLEGEGHNVLQTSSGTLYIETLDELCDERWVKLSVIIPKASEEDGTDGYSLANEYLLACEEKAEKAKLKEEEKAKKLAKKKEKEESAE